MSCMKLIKLRDDRIGHLALNTELFLRTNKAEDYLAIASTNPANEQLLRMISRKIKVIRLPRKLIDFIPANQMIFSMEKYRKVSHKKPQLEFNFIEHTTGLSKLKEMGVDSWFVCFHARDSAYLKNKVKKDTSYLDFRNCNINNYVKAMEYITKKGGYAIRMGSITDQKLNTKNPKIIDYASKYRSDFMDIWLSANCKLFVGCTSGLYNVATIFNRPVALANVIPENEYPLQKDDKFITKRENSPEEILSLTKEMMGVDR